MTTEPKIAPTTMGKVLYAGPAGTVYTDGLKLYNLTAQGVGVMGVMAGGPNNQPTPEEVTALNKAGSGAFGPFKPWMVSVAFVVLFVALGAAGAPTWAVWLVGLLALAVLVGYPVYRQFKAYEGLFRSRDELTILLSPTPTQAVSSMVELRPDSPAQSIKPAQQPVAVVVYGLPLAERVKLSGSVTRHVALSRRKK